MRKIIPSRVDYEIISDLVEHGSRVLDLGCGDGELLEMLVTRKGVTGQGVEIDEANIGRCIARGVNAIHTNLDEGLADYQNGSFDYVVLNQTLQVVFKPDYVLQEMVRVGKKAIVGFPNFAHLAIRLQLLFKGVMPKTADLPFEWYNTPNIHLLTIRDFERFCREKNLHVADRVFINKQTSISPYFLPDLLARSAIYVIQKGRTPVGQ
jgi:methionine biosynthesis protein MetW